MLLNVAAVIRKKVTDITFDNSLSLSLFFFFFFFFFHLIDNI